jgi:hypothetical protein
MAVTEVEALESKNPDPPGDNRPWKWAALIGFPVLAVIVVLGIAWWSTGLGGNRPSAVITAVVSVVAVVIVFFVAKLVLPQKKVLRGTASVITAIACLIIVAAASNGSLLVVKMKANEAAWLAAANQALRETTAQSQPCTTPPIGQADLPGIGRVDERCVVLPGLHENVQVSLIRNEGSASSGLLYMPASADLKTRWDQCVAHLDGRWWQISWPSGSGCPAGFQFIGSG